MGKVRAVNMDKLAQKRAEEKMAGDFWNPSENTETVVYITGPWYTPEEGEPDELPFYPVRVHYSIGPSSKAMCICLDASKNHILTHPGTVTALRTLGKNLSGGCYVCEQVAKCSEEEQKEKRGQNRFVWVVIPMKQRALGSTGPFSPFAPPNTVKLFMCGWKQYNKLLDQYGSGGQISDPAAATYVRITRKGSKLQTEWDAQVDVETLRKPVVLPADASAALEAALEPDGAADVYRVVAGMAKSREDQKALWAGGTMDAEVVDAEETTAKPGTPNMDALIKERGSKPPTCFSFDCSPSDEDCRTCAWKAECAPLCGIEIPPDPPKPAAAKPAAAKPKVAPAKPATTTAKPTPEPKPAPAAAAPAKPNGKTTTTAKPAAPKARPVPIPEPEPEPEAEEVAEEAEMATIPASECQEGSQYVIGEDLVAEYKGSAKGFHFFQDGEGKRYKMAGDAEVGVISAEASDEEPAAVIDDDGAAAVDNLMAQLAKAKAARK